jgi:hypothetical protein
MSSESPLAVSTFSFELPVSLSSGLVATITSFSLSPIQTSTNMSKRHNRKRTRSRPRHRDGGKAHSANHTRTFSMDTNASIYSSSSFQPFPIVNAPSEHWHQTYSTWHDRLRYERERERVMEAQRLRFFGGEAGEEFTLLEPMLKVVTDLFDGMTDYEDP